MAATDIVIATLGVDEAPAGLALSAEAHWNQNEADWRFFLAKGTVFGVRDAAGLLVATAALLPYAAGNAWISMVLVTANWRRRGLATRLVDACHAEAAKQGLVCWLDATPAGATVYSPLGFAPTIELRRLRFVNSTSERAAASRPLAAANIKDFIARDIEAMGFDRSALLSELSGRSGSRLLTNGDAMALVRDGRTARHIGPLFADSADRALALVGDIVRSGSGPVLIDAVGARHEFLDGMTGSGWTIERPFQRMRFGNATMQAAEPPFAVAGPEYG